MNFLERFLVKGILKNKIELLNSHNSASSIQHFYVDITIHAVIAFIELLTF